ncbi:MAG: O-antigen ligase family protein [Parcubacteria group bacterium]
MKKYLNLENYFLLVIFLLPAYLLRFTIFKIPENLWEILAVISIILALEKIKKENNFTLSGYEKKIIFLFLIIIIGLALGMIKSGNYSVGLGIIKSWFLVPFAFAFLANRIIEDKKRLYSSLYLSILIVAVIALIYKFLGILTFDGRLQAFFNSPNYLAMFLAPGVIIGVFSSGLKNLKLLKILKLIIIALAIFFTYSYASWISIIFAVLIIFFLTHKISGKHILFLVLIFLIVVFLSKDTSKFQDLANYNSRSSLASRIMIWQSAEKIAKDNYLIGIGPGNFQDKYLEYQKYFPPYLQWAAPHPHNLYLAFWLSAGLIGLLAFIGILYLFFTKVEMRQSAMIETRHCLVSTVAAGIIIYFLLHGLVDTTYFKNDLSVVFWMAIFLV